MTFKDKTVCYLKSWDGKRVKAPYYTKHSGRIKLPQAGNICLLIRTINVMNFSNKDQTIYINYITVYKDRGKKDDIEN